MERDEQRENAIDEVLRRWFRDAIDCKPRDVTKGIRPDIENVLFCINDDGDFTEQMERIVKAYGAGHVETVGSAVDTIIGVARERFLKIQSWRDRAARTLTGDDHE